MASSTGYRRVLCDQQNCDIDRYEGRYTVDLPQGAMFDEEVPKQCYAGFVGDSIEAIRQTSPFCARVSEGGFYAPIGSRAPTACDAGHYSLPASKSAGDCLKCHAGTYADSEGTENCDPCTPGSFQHGFQHQSLKLAFHDGIALGVD